jgi:hypothetical protein
MEEGLRIFYFFNPIFSYWRSGGDCRVSLKWAEFVSVTGAKKKSPTGGSGTLVELMLELFYKQP